MRRRERRSPGLAAMIVAGGMVSGLTGGCYQGHTEPIDGASGGTADGDEQGTADDDGVDDGDSGDDGVQSQCDTPSPGASPIRRLTGWEYDNTVATLLGDTTRPSQATGFPQEGGSGFDNNADVGAVTWLMANKYMLAAEAVAARAVTDLDALLPCDPVADESGCVAQFIAEFGPRAWRRPLTAQEQADLEALFADSRQRFALETSIDTVLQALLQSPHFLYRVELGVGQEQGEPAVRLTDWEMASRLSYLLWGTMPDDTLFAAAAAGQLSTREQIETEARRMLDDERARPMVTHFAEQWLGYADLAVTSKDPELFPGWTASIAEKQQAESNAFFEHVMFEGDATLRTLLTAPYTFADAELATFYGYPAPVGGGLGQITPPADKAAGILSQGGVLAVYSKPNQTSPIARGIFVREHLLCTIPPPPPDNANINPPQPDPNATTREQYEQHRSDPACAGCHVLFDPIGFGFENFDAVGRWRDTENGKAVDASGELAATDVNGPFDGVAGLGEALADSQDVADCVARQWFRYANGRTESAELDACNLDTVNAAFAESGYDMRELLVALTQADAFLFRTAYADEGGN